MYTITIQKDGEKVQQWNFEKVRFSHQKGIIRNIDTQKNECVTLEYNGEEIFTIEAWSGCVDLKDFIKDEERRI